jgi:hypothetical protein
LALDMGHSTTKMICSNYREILTPEEAEAVLADLSDRPEENVVAMAQAS